MGKNSLLFFSCVLLWILYRSFVLSEEKTMGTVVGQVTVTVNGLFGQKEQRTKEDVVIFLDGVKRDNSLSSEDKVRMSQKGKQFYPQILPIVVGTTVYFPNDDNIYHNVFSLSKIKSFDLGLYKAGDISKSVTFDKTGLVKVYCNIHPQMIADILVLNNPYFTFTDKDGNFILPEVSPGNYKIRTWGRRVESATKDIIITNRQVLNVEFNLMEKKYNTYHKNKYGKDYKNKY